MEINILCLDYAINKTGANGVQIIGAYYDLEKAKKIMKEEFGREDPPFSDIIKEEDELSMTLYEEGYYSQNHIHYFIQVTKIN